jgi:hypothetical protein
MISTPWGGPDPEVAMTWDPADDPRARANRAGKAEALTGWCRDRGLSADTVNGLDEVTRRRAARDAGVNPPRAESPTWGMVRAALADDPPALADVPPAGHTQWCPGCDLADLHPTGNGDAEPLAVESPPATRLAGPSVLPAAPNSGRAPTGWAEMVALGPVDPRRPCTVPGPDGSPCAAPAVTRMMTASGRDVWRCAGHPPQPGEWGHRLDHTPTRCARPARCYCGRCDLDQVAPGVTAG